MKELFLECILFQDVIHKLYRVFHDGRRCCNRRSPIICFLILFFVMKKENFWAKMCENDFLMERKMCMNVFIPLLKETFIFCDDFVLCSTRSPSAISWFLAHHGAQLASSMLSTFMMLKAILPSFNECMSFISQNFMKGKMCTCMTSRSDLLSNFLSF